jgi:hypothetical protein
MIKNIVIVVLVIAVLGEGYFLWKHHEQAAMQVQTAMTAAPHQNIPPQAGPDSRRKGGAPIMLSHGDNLKTSPLFKYAFEIAPTMPDSSKKALTGFTMTTQKQSDGSIVVSITPKDSDDQSQQYTVKSGNTLYFIEQTPVDDKVDQDKDLNYRDDYGIITDSSGVIQ